MNERQSTTLTFFSLDDFLAELARREFAFVRCEAIMQDQGSGQMGPLRRYLVTLTAHDDEVNEVLTCSLLVGECWAVMANHERHHGENLNRAEEIITAHLKANGFTVMPGVYHHAKDGIATASGLWRFESRRLISITEDTVEEPT